LVCADVNGSDSYPEHAGGSGRSGDVSRRTIQSHDERLPVIVRNVGVNLKQQVWRKGQRSSWRNVWLLVGQGLSEVT
jgi:hypothetical protein